MPDPRVVEADNPGPFTLEGTRTYLVGDAEVAVVDPGPDVESHVRAVVRGAGSADRVVLLQTHDHDDHAGASSALSDRLDAPVLGAGDGCRTLDDGDEVPTDQGVLVAVSTPGHAREHLCFHWPEARAVFVGDLILGRGETTWVGAYPGCVADYLTSLERILALEPRVLHPAHGPPITDPGAAIDRFRSHRLDRVEQVRRALDANPGADAAELVQRIYGDELPEAVRSAAEASVRAHAHHVREDAGS